MRQDVLTQLQRHLKAVLSKRPGQVVGLWGEPGVGKTFTVRELLQETPCGNLSLPATTVDASLLSSLPRPSKLPAWAEAGRERLDQEGSVSAQVLVDTLAATLSALAPFVLHLEDLHEADPERLGMVRKLAETIPHLRGVGLLVSSRAELPAPFVNYRLEPLDQAGSDELLEAEAGAKLPREGLDWVFARTQGNPLFTLEFWRFLTRQGFFWSDGQSWHWRQPPQDFMSASVEALISQLASGVVGVNRQILEARAMIPLAFDPAYLEPLWLAVAGVEAETLAEARKSLEARGLLRGKRFVHPLFREVVEREIPVERKQTYSRRALAALEPAHPEWAAEFIEAARPEHDCALRLLERAAARAETEVDVPSHGRWLSMAVEWSAGADKTRRALQAARVLRGVQPVQAIHMAEIAASASPPDPEAVCLLAEMLAFEGFGEEAKARLRALPPLEDPGLRWWETQIGVAVHSNLWLKAIETWNEHPEHQTGASLHTQRFVGTSYAFLNRLEEAEKIADELLKLDGLSPANQVGILNLCGQIQTYKGNYATALEVNERFLELCRALGRRQILIRGLLNHAANLGILGRRSEAKACLEEAKGLAARAGDPVSYAVIQLRLAGELIDEGEYEQAETLCLEAQTLLYRGQRIQWQTECHLKQARLYLGWQSPHGLPLALKHARVALELARSNQDAEFLVSALAYSSRAESLAGNSEAALRLAEECLDVCQQKNLETKLSDAWFAYGLALEAGRKNPEALEAIRRACRQQSESRLAERFGLEADRMTSDLERARKRYDWFVSQGLLGPARIALRYFPQLAPKTLAAVTQVTPELCLNVLGAVQLERVGQPIPYRGKKRLELLCYLLEARLAGRGEVSVLELADTFYPEADEVKAKATLKQQVHLIRMTLGQQTVHSTPNGYALGDVASDAEAFLQGGSAELWRGPYLEHLSEGWYGSVREALIQALSSRSEALVESEPKEASRLARLLLEMEPYDAQFLRLALRSAAKSGDMRAALRLHREAGERLLEVGEALPELEALLGGALSA